ncbi:unnamed protein product [Rotaria magnacalcarata]|uniref:Uncharacterized protein n=1 Tax=Rotaria magnacalcarata TaxID=392030 RepID=A0A816LB06_9BILA|nr:unnamed protein product [Rotaria magnacalcarata]CAF1943991.1 unnamed protein product [Rotaria magnacalcarata]CAF2030547.1 unnamed protein product [Rotaria magnacalcarata]CAF2262468.1 unnamed protein product [Rotaria magnacalcarata]CAF3803084.1 unnamed protein product [Rotaria magnacalcarata]
MNSSSVLLNNLRQLMKSKKYFNEIIHAYIVPTTDPHKNEYVADRYKRREFISNFTGSNGTAVITDNQALLWTDGRYFCQAEHELDSTCWKLMRDGTKDVPSITNWISRNLEKNSFVGCDPQLLSINEWKEWKDTLEQADKQLVPIEINLIDILWDKQRPELPQESIWKHDIQFSGASISEKLLKVRTKMNEYQVNHLILHRTDDIAWLFNLRGGDIPYNPVFLSFSIISIDHLKLFVDLNKLSESIKNDLENENIQIYSYDLFYEQLKEDVQFQDPSHKFFVSPSCNYAVQTIISKKQLVIQDDIVYELKAIKNPCEIQGMKQSHIKDGVALCSYIHWLEENIQKNETITELSGAEKLRLFRCQQQNYLYDSFETISASGKNASIIHYKPTEESDKTITSNELYLVDSGGQYKEGTTDVTRTLHFGQPTDFEKECFTRVLKGFISLASCLFPPNTTGARLDSFARRALWDVGLDYRHGTGHGVGCCLNVHEGPQSIGTRIRSDNYLVSGMILSDEPGFYLDDKFGIRIENCVVVIKKNSTYAYYDEKWLTFEQLTMVPIQTKLIDRSLLTDHEIDYINKYHEQVRQHIGDEIKKQNLQESLLEWLEINTQPI